MSTPTIWDRYTPEPIPGKTPGKDDSVLGKGTYGVVFKAKENGTDRIVAIKKTILDDDEDGVPATTIREVALLKELSNHRNIVHLLHVSKENQVIYLVFEFLENDLAKYIQKVQGPLDPPLVKSFLYQILLGINFCHMHRVLHRDLKPQNLLIDDSGLLKIADFGLARAVSTSSAPLTLEVLTVWYRAPEVLLGVREYTAAVDIWSIGAIFAEMVNKKPLLPGAEYPDWDQLYKTFELFGTPNEQIWPGFSELPYNRRRPKPQFLQWIREDLGKKVPLLAQDHNGIDLLRQMMLYDPSRRISAKDALRHSYFDTLDRTLYAPFNANPVL